MKEADVKNLIKEFSDGWRHFCGCIDWKFSYMDADAIRFMNETPGKIIEALKQIVCKE